jgi:indolepyruvate ferredoxin oxidoreductase beta subunit
LEVGCSFGNRTNSEVALLAGYDVKKGEVHGMSQRGGIIASHLRFGKNKPLPSLKRARLILSWLLRRLEALRTGTF